MWDIRVPGGKQISPTIQLQYCHADTVALLGKLFCGGFELFYCFAILWQVSEMF